MSLAHLAGIAGVLLLARRRGWRLEPFVDLIFVVLLAGLLGGRVGYLLEHPGELGGVAAFFALQRGGLSFFGGLALAFPAYLAFLLRRKLPVWETSDLLAPVLPFSLAVLRLGCFGAGCCYGAPTTLPWGMLPLYPPAALRGLPLHPSALYESCFLLLLAAATAWHARRPRSPAGVTAALCLGAYGAYRLLFDTLRGDLLRSLPGGFSASQALGGLLLLLALAVIAARYRAARTFSGGAKI